MKVQERLRYNDRHVLDRLGHRRQSTFDRISDTYSPSTTKSGPDRANFEDRSHSRSRPHRQDSSNRDNTQSRDRSRGVKELYDNTRYSFGKGTKRKYCSRDRDCSRYEKKGMESESPLFHISESGTSYGGHWKSRSKRHKPTNEDDMAVPWICEEVERWAMSTWCHMSNSTLIGAARVWFDELPPKSIDGYKDLKAAFLAYFMQQKKYVKDPVELHNIKQRDGETIEEFMEQFKLVTKRMKGAPECMRIFGFMHGVNNPKLTKRLNEHVPKTMEEMMITSTAFIRGEVAGAGKKKGHTSWRIQDQSKRHASERRSDFRGMFKPPPPMVTSVEKRSSNKFCNFHNDKGHITDECMQLKKQIEELVRAGKLSNLIKEIKQGKDQPKVGKKEIPTKDKSMAIYMIQRWQRMTRQRVTQSFERVREITFPLLTTSSGTEGPLVIEAEIGGHTIHRMEIPKEAGVHLENFKVATHPNFPDQEVAIGGILSTKGRTELYSLLKENLDIFAWQPSDMTGMAESDEEKTAFHTSQGVYCYTKMPFGLKNVGATYQRPVDKAFDSQVGRNIEVYVDDLVIKSLTEAEMLRDIDETFRTLRKINMKLNPQKCTFGAVKGMFLGYMISSEGIRPWPNKTEAILQLPSPRTIKENDFHWTPEAEQAFKQLKQHLSELPLLVAPKQKEELIVYLSATHGAISAVLMTKRGTVQTSVYFLSHALQGPELNYTPMEKLVLSLVFSAKRLRRYFQAYPIAVITDQPIKQIISRPDVAGRLQKWSVMLGEQNITFWPRTSMKGQILTDFLIEKLDKSPSNTLVVETPQEPWTVFTDESSCVDGSDAGLILTSPDGTEFTYALRFLFTASNNEAEYEALIAGLWIMPQMGVRNVHVRVDSKLVANQVLGAYVTKEENMIKYLEKVKSLVSSFASFFISQVPQSQNKKGDALSKIASTNFAHLSKQVLVKILKEKSIQEEEVTTMVEEDG
ncbi:reverse transcriptase domain-containing protein [Tanacetum coccineum]|uniref:Reverse transcriptase domain-containing protein n=1 Tax=Tanacetum coccineum TaxID=301880 RepID=A0ABQ5EGZ4_9ASTR